MLIESVVQFKNNIFNKDLFFCKKFGNKYIYIYSTLYTIFTFMKSILLLLFTNI